MKAARKREEVSRASFDCCETEGTGAHPREAEAMGERGGGEKINSERRTEKRPRVRVKGGRRRGAQRGKKALSLPSSPLSCRVH